MLLMLQEFALFCIKIYLNLCEDLLESCHVVLDFDNDRRISLKLRIAPTHSFLRLARDEGR